MYEIINISEREDNRGRLYFLQNGIELPFDIARCFWIKDVPSGERRGAHAHRTCAEIIIAVNGAFKVDVTDGERCATIMMDSSTKALYIPPYTWCELYDFTTNAICLCVASQEYDPSGYINNFEEYKQIMRYGKSI